jgi:hypothetical protein
MRASRRLMPTAEDLPKVFEYWVQSHLLEKELGGRMDRINDMEELRKGYKSIRLSLAIERRHGPRRLRLSHSRLTFRKD